MKTRYFLSITLPDYATWDAYDYGAWQTVESAELPNGRIAFLADYGQDEYRAKYQRDRYASGLHFGTVLETTDENLDKLVPHPARQK